MGSDINFNFQYFFCITLLISCPPINKHDWLAWYMKDQVVALGESYLQELVHVLFIVPEILHQKILPFWSHFCSARFPRAQNSLIADDSSNAGVKMETNSHLNDNSDPTDPCKTNLNTPIKTGIFAVFLHYNYKKKLYK